MGTNCASLSADEGDFMMSLPEDTQADIISAFKSTSRYLGDLSNIDNPYFEGVKMYPIELQLNKVNSTYTEAPFFRFCIYLFQTVLFHSKLMMNAMTLILTVLVFRYWMPMFLHLIVFTLLNLFGLQECRVIWLISMLVRKLWLPNVSNMNISIINFGKFFFFSALSSTLRIGFYDTGQTTSAIRPMWTWIL